MTTTTMPSVEPSAPTAGRSESLAIAGWVLTGLGGSVLLFDGLNRLVQTPTVPVAAAVAGWQPWIAIIGLVNLAIHLVPRTSVLGAILLTGYLGGAVAANIGTAAPFIADILSGGGVGIVLGAGLYLRNPELRRLLLIGR